jgi:hypothetical protein
MTQFITKIDRFLNKHGMFLIDQNEAHFFSINAYLFLTAVEIHLFMDEELYQFLQVRQ